MLARAASQPPAATLQNVGGNQSLAARVANPNVQSSSAVVQRVSWDDNAASNTTVTARNASCGH